MQIKNEMISQDGDKNDQFKYDNGECGVKGTVLRILLKRSVYVDSDNMDIKGKKIYYLC